MQRILAVDDSSSVRKLVEFSLKSRGYQVVSAEDGQEAMEVLARDSFQVIILDINMPRMDGLELLKRIRAGGDSIPVIMLTTEGQDEDRERALLLGATDYLVKPFKPTELLKAVERALIG